jgi:hypothetical protein
MAGARAVPIGAGPEAPSSKTAARHARDEDARIERAFSFGAHRPGASRAARTTRDRNEANRAAG